MRLSKIKTFQDELVNAIIETPKGSVYKYDYDPKLEVFCLDKIMPLGMKFPFDFGFIAGTKGEDGDPLDIILLMDQPNIPGIVVRCRVVGVLEAIQMEHDGRHVRNDRIIGVSNLSREHEKIWEVKDLSSGVLNEIGSFFKHYNVMAGKEFQILGWKGSGDALELIQSHAD